MMMLKECLPDSLTLVGLFRAVLMVEELDITLLVIDLVHLEN